MERHCTTVSFSLRMSKKLKNGLVPIEVSIYVNSERISFLSGKYVEPSQWNREKQLVKEKTKGAKELNSFFTELVKKTYRKEAELMERGFNLTASLLRDAVLDRVDILNEKTLVSFLSEYIESKRGMIGKGITEATFYSYEYTMRMLQEHIPSKYKRQDVSLREVNLLFMQGWHSFLLQRMSQNTATKYLSFLKSLMGYAVANGYIQYNLIQGYKVERSEPKVEFLDDVELAKFLAYESPMTHMMVARDMFLFGCYTGLSYSDICSLGIEHLYFDEQRRLWIKKKRVKTGVLSRIPVLPKAKEIIIKYAVQNLYNYDHRFVPIQDLADINKNIKKICKEVGIAKHVTFHTSRHTFATTVTLSNHISLEVVSKMMGHTNTRMTSHYARVVDKCIAEEMETLLTESPKQSSIQ